MTATVKGLADKASSRHVLIFVCLVMFFDAMGVGLILPVMPQLIVELSDLSVNRAAEIGGYLMFTFAAMQFVTAPILGGLSDRFGRRPVLLIAMAGFSLDYFVMAGAPSLIWLFVARFFSGILGATYPAANACAVDISAPEDRARNFGFLGASIGLGFVFGPALGGILGEFGSRLPFLVSGILTAIVCVYGYFALPETLEPKKRRAFELKRSNPFGSLISVARYPIVIWLVASAFLMQFAAQSYVSIWAYFTIEILDWAPLAIGISAGVYGATIALFQGGLTGPVVKRFGEVRAASFSLAVGLAIYLGLAFVSSAAGLYFWVLISGFTAFSFPAMQSIMTKQVPEDAQGELQGALASCFSIAAIVGPLAMTQIFSAWSDEQGIYLPGAPFIVGACLIAASLAAFWAGVMRLPAGEGWSREI